MIFYYHVNTGEWNIVLRGTTNSTDTGKWCDWGIAINAIYNTNKKILFEYK